LNSGRNEVGVEAQIIWKL